MNALIIILHIIVCLILIFAILLQSAKPADKTGTDEKAAQPAEKTDPQKPPATGGTAEKK